MEEDVRHRPVSQLMGSACFQGKYWTVSSSWYFSISLPISFSISTIVNQLSGAVNSFTSTCCALNHLLGVTWLGWDEVPCVNEGTFSPRCCGTFPHWPCHIKQSSSCSGSMILGGDLMESGDCFPLLRCEFEESLSSFHLFLL